MPSKDELEQELDIVSAEYDQKCKELHAAQQEIALLKGEAALAKEANERVIEMVRSAAADAGVDIPETALAITAATERAEIEVAKAGLERELEALGELRNPSGKLVSSDQTESTLDIVRANQRERFELQQRSATANTLLSRIAGLMNLDRWDEEGGELMLAKLQRFSTLRAKLAAQLKSIRKEAAGTGTPYERGRIDMAEWVQNLLNGSPEAARDLNGLRRLEMIVSGNPLPVHFQPDTTVREARRAALAIQYPHGAEPPLPADQWLMYDETGTPVPLDVTMRELVLPTERIVVTLPVGSGA